jgi:hypothetical protein
MTTRNAPRRQHWRSDGTEPLPSGAEALGEPFAAFPSWFLRIECDRCGKVQMVNEAHAWWRDRSFEHHREDASRRHRHRGREQPPRAEDRPARGPGLSDADVVLIRSTDPLFRQAGMDLDKG